MGLVQAGGVEGEREVGEIGDGPEKEGEPGVGEEEGFEHGNRLLQSSCIVPVHPAPTTLTPTIHFTHCHPRREGTTARSGKP